MARFVGNKELDLLAAAYAKIAETIFLSIFTEDWVGDYMSFAEYAVQEKLDLDPFRAIENQDDARELSEAIDPMLAAKCFFTYAWNLFKSTCAENQIVIGPDQANDFLTAYVPGAKTIWGKLIDLITELEDFRRMAWNQIADYMEEQERNEQMARERTTRNIEILVESRMQKTSQAYRPDMTETTFGMEIKGLVEAIVAKKIPCTVEELREILAAKIPTLAFHQLQGINAFEELLAKTQRHKEPAGDANVEIDVNKITKHLVTPRLEAIDCVVSIDHESGGFYIKGQKFNLDFPDFNRALHKILEITPPIFFQKRLKEFLDFLEEYAKKSGVLPMYAKYVFYSFKVHREKQMEVMNHIKKYEVKWEIRFPILVGVLGMKHTRHIDQGLFAAV